MYRNKSAEQHQFAMVPQAEIPRAQFRRQSGHKTTFDAGYLVPVYVDEVLPGDTFNMRATMFARMATPIFPVMDNLYLDTFWFYVPLRLLWTNFKKFMGEQDNPADSISYTVPQQVCPASGYAVGSLQDYMGLPTVGQVVGGNTVTHAAFWTRAYNRIWNEWFRDENLQNSVTVDLGDGPDTVANYVLLRRGKRHDYFTSCLPWTQKFTPPSIPLGSTAPVKSDFTTFTMRGAVEGVDRVVRAAMTTGTLNLTTAPPSTQDVYFGADTGLYADLSAATGATINALRQSFQIQKLLERDARGGSRYTEIVRAHFGVISPDARLQRSEYIGGDSTPINISPIAQTSATSITGGATPLGSLSAFGTALSQGNGFTASFTEHGVILCLVSVRADLTYQQGLDKMWSRSTRYDFYFPAFANLGEQPVLNKEIYCDGSANDAAVFGYQERWAEYRYKPSKISGLFKSTSAGTIDGWHLAQKFTALPTLGTTFIQDTPPMSRVLAVGAGANGQQFIFDSLFDNTVARPMPLYSVPGLIDHF